MHEPATQITDSNQDDMESLLSTVAEIAERTRRMENTLDGFREAFRRGGIKGLRSFASRPDPDGSRAKFLTDGLTALEGGTDG